MWPVLIVPVRSTAMNRGSPYATRRFETILDLLRHCRVGDLREDGAGPPTGQIVIYYCR